MQKNRIDKIQLLHNLKLPLTFVTISSLFSLLHWLHLHWGLQCGRLPSTAAPWCQGNPPELFWYETWLDLCHNDTPPGNAYKVQLSWFLLVTGRLGCSPPATHICRTAYILLATAQVLHDKPPELGPLYLYLYLCKYHLYLLRFLFAQTKWKWISIKSTYSSFFITLFAVCR